MPVRFFVLATAYLLALIGVFVMYVTWSGFRSGAPSSLGPLPIGVAWFGATGAVLASLWGIFNPNTTWDSSYDYWYYIRPLFGAVTGSVDALFYWVTLDLGNAKGVAVDRTTFDVVGFVFGFADAAFIQMLKNVTNVIIKPGSGGSGGSGGRLSRPPIAVAWAISVVPLRRKPIA